jgi:twinkle protein
MDIEESEFEVEVVSKPDPLKLTRVFTDLKSRGISQEVCEIYGVKAAVDEKGNDIFHFYPNTRGGKWLGSYCIREVANKKFSWWKAKEGGDFFGQAECGSGGKLLIVTEGAADMLAAKQMLLNQGKNYRICSVINGAQSAAKLFRQNYEWVNSFDSIILAFDMDQPGQEAAVEVADLFQLGKVKIMEMSEKDPNDMLKANKSVEFLRALYNAKAEKVQGVLSIDDVYEDALRPAVMGKSYPWPSLTKAVYGRRLGEIVGVGSAPAGGKTQFLKELIDHAITEHGDVVGACFLEESPAMSAKQLAGIRHSQKFHLPSEDGGWKLQDLKEGLDYLKGKVYLYDSLGSKSWENIEKKVRYMVAAFGVTLVIIDNLTALLSEETDDFKALNIIMPSMSTLAIELNISIFFVSHLKKKTGTAAHSEGGQVSMEDF